MGLIEDILSGKIKTKQELEKAKHSYNMMMSNAELLSLIPPDKISDDVLKLLRTKPIRTLSGVAVVAIMTKPYPCPGRCIYCPGGVESNTPKSYTGKEPAALRAAMNNYDPYLQVHNRLKQLFAIGHKPSKVELIVMGGTWEFFPKDYREWFIRRAIQAMNDFPEVKPDRSLELTQQQNETANIRCVGITFETRPDYCQDVEHMLDLGGTRVELGVQSIYDDVLSYVKRGHSIEDTVKATERLKNAAFKVNYHIMLNLPKSDPDRDFNMVKTIFEDERFRPDMVKFYPTLVMKGTPLYSLWKRGKYRSYDMDTLLELLERVIAITPPWVRIMRVQRDIPVPLTDAGPSKGNLRQILLSKGIRCRDIRCREPFDRPLGKLTPVKREYHASNGTEIFLSYEDLHNDRIAGFLRLRIDDHASVRELHVYGEQTPVGEFGDVQHKGIGSSLLEWAEKLSREFSMREIRVISGIGVREYYRKHGYRFIRPYMVKRL